MSESEGKPHGEGKPEPQAKPESQHGLLKSARLKIMCPRKESKKTDRGMDDSPKDHQEDLQERHLGGAEMMTECGDVPRAQEEPRKKQNYSLSGSHWMQRDVFSLLPSKCMTSGHSPLSERHLPRLGHDRTVVKQQGLSGRTVLSGI